MRLFAAALIVAALVLYSKLQTLGPPGSGSEFDSAALERLEKSGAIRKPSEDEIKAWVEAASARYRSRLAPDYRVTVRPIDYAVTRAIQIPRGMHGGHSKVFLVLPRCAPSNWRRWPFVFPVRRRHHNKPPALSRQ